MSCFDLRLNIGNHVPNILRGGAAQIYHEVGVLGGNLELANLMAFEAQAFNEFGDEMSRRVFENRATAGFLEGLALAAFFKQVFDVL